MEVKNIGHQDSVTMGTYDIEEIEKSNENKVDIIWKQSQQIEKLKDKLQKQAECIENNKNKAKNCAMQMQNQGKEIQRLKQSNKDLMAVIWKTKREKANKGREVCKVNNEVVQYKKRIAELEEQLKQAQNQKAIEELTMFEAILNRAVQWDNDSKCWTISEEVFGNFIVQIDEKIEELRGEE